MQNTSKLDAVHHVLSTRPEIKGWYAEQHGLDVSALTHASVRTYGTGYHGEIADAILSDAGVEQDGHVYEVA
jgi:hypothetical protein